MALSHRPAPPTATPTILLLSLPPSLLLGIDLQTLTTTPAFHGLKDLPPGHHFLFASETLSDTLRAGFWFHIPATTAPAPLLVYTWDATALCLRAAHDAESYRGNVPGEGLSPYRQLAAARGGGGAETEAEDVMGAWPALTAHLKPGILSHLTQSEEWRIETGSCAVADRDEISGVVWDGGEVGVLGIERGRRWREGAVGRERTEGAVDASWGVGDVVARWEGREDGGVGGESGAWGDVLLGQMEACFVMVVTVGNFSCLEEWKRIVGLVLGCKRLVREREEWFVGFLGVLRRQMGRVDDVEGGLFDMSDEGGELLRGCLRGFKRGLAEVFGEGEGKDVKDEMEELEEVLRKLYGWELGDEFVRKGMLELEDGEMVEMEVGGMEGEDESGEYAPVVVDLENT